MLDYIIYLVVGGFVTWFIKTQKVFSYVFIGDTLTYMRNCGICLGWWVLSGLYWVFHPTLISPTNGIETIVDCILVAAISSFIIYVFKAGWHSLFVVMVIE